MTMLADMLRSITMANDGSKSNLAIRHRRRQQKLRHGGRHPFSSTGNNCSKNTLRHSSALWLEFILPALLHR